ncbi:hypothetical protein QEN19_000984 [Hanseniaspora menglaensis]
MNTESATYSKNQLTSYKLSPPTDQDINPLVNTDIFNKNKKIKTSNDYPDFFPWVHTNPKINKIYLNNLINGYTTSDLLSKNPLNEDRKLYVTTNSNSNGNNTSTTSLGENESGYKLFRITNNTNQLEEIREGNGNTPNNKVLNEDTVDLNLVLDNVVESFNKIKNIRNNTVNKGNLSVTIPQALPSIGSDSFIFVKTIKSIVDESVFTKSFITEKIANHIISLKCKNWTPHMISVINEILEASPITTESNEKFQYYWRLFNTLALDLKVLKAEEFFQNWLLPFISNSKSLSGNGNSINEKLPIIKFITLEVTLRFLPSTLVIYLNELLQSLISLALPKDSIFSDVINEKLINPLLTDIFNSRDASNFKIITSFTNNDYEEKKFLKSLETKYLKWISIFNYLEDTSGIDLEKLQEIQIWNESIALKYLHLLPSGIFNNIKNTCSINYGIKLTNEGLIALTTEFDPEKFLSHSMLQIVKDEKIINTFKFHTNIQNFGTSTYFNEENYWFILITLFLKSKQDIKFTSLVILTNYLINEKKLNINNFFLKLISSGVLHNAYVKNFGIFLINLNVMNNSKQYDSILSKYFKNLFDEYNSKKLKQLINAENEIEHAVTSILICRSNSYLEKIMYEDSINDESISTAAYKFISHYKGQYHNFWVYLNHSLTTGKIHSFKALKLLLDYIIFYKPKKDLFDFSLIFDYYMRMEQSMILQDLQFSEHKKLKLQYVFDFNMINTDISTIKTEDYNIYDFQQTWILLASVYEEEDIIFRQLINYESSKKNNIFTYNMVKENIPHNISHLKDEISNHGILQQFLTKTFREYFSHKDNAQYLTNIKVIKFMFNKTFNNFIPYFIKRLKLDSHDNDTSFFQKIISLINDDILNINLLFNRLPLDDIVSFMNYVIRIENEYSLIKYQLSDWLLKDDETITNVLSNKKINPELSYSIIYRFMSDKMGVISKWLINEKILLCNLLNIDYKDWFLKLNEENIFTQLIYKLDFNNCQFMKLLLNEFINNLNIDEILNIITNLHSDFIIKSFLVIDFNTIEDYGNQLLNEFLNKVLDFTEDEIMIHLITNNIKLNENCLKNFVISQDNLKKIISKLSFVKQNNDQASLEKIFQVMLVYNIKDIKLNIKNNYSKNSSCGSNGMSLKNRILACLVNDKLYLDNSNTVDHKSIDIMISNTSTVVEVTYLRSNK